MISKLPKFESLPSDPGHTGVTAAFCKVVMILFVLSEIILVQRQETQILETQIEIP